MSMPFKSSSHIGDIRSPSTGTSFCPTGSTPRNRTSNASAPSNGIVPSSLNTTSVTLFAPFYANPSASHVPYASDSPCANRNCWLDTGGTPSSRSMEPGTDVTDAPVSTRASNSIQFSPCGSPMLIGTLKVPMLCPTTRPCGLCGLGSRRSLLRRGWGRACLFALPLRCRASSASLRQRRQS